MDKQPVDVQAECCDTAGDADVSVDGWPGVHGTGRAGSPPGPVGRHRLHRSPARIHAVKVLYGPDELAVVQQAAAAAGLRPSSYVAAAALAAAAGGQPPGGGGQDRLVLAELLQLRSALRRFGTNLNQAAAVLNSGGEAPVWLERAVAGGERVVARIDEAAGLLVRRLQ